MGMKCPNCGLFNPESAVGCDCGYDFRAKKVYQDADEPDPTYKQLTQRVARVAGLVMMPIFALIILFQVVFPTEVRGRAHFAAEDFIADLAGDIGLAALLYLFVYVVCYGTMTARNRRRMRH